MNERKLLIEKVNEYQNGKINSNKLSEYISKRLFEICEDKNDYQSSLIIFQKDFNIPDHVIENIEVHYEKLINQKG